MNFRRGTLKSTSLICTAIVLSASLLINTTAFAKERTTGRGTGPVIFVTSQGLYFDSIVVVDPLPMHGNFQKLTPGVNGLETEFGLSASALGLASICVGLAEAAGEFSATVLTDRLGKRRSVAVGAARPTGRPS